MCTDCSICGKNRKVKETTSIKRGYITFTGKVEYNLDGIPIYPLTICHICGCSCISDVGGFSPEWKKKKQL